MSIEIVCDFERIFCVALHAQPKRFQALQDQEGVEWRQRSTRIAQWHYPAATDEGCWAEGFGVGHTVVGRVRRVQQGETFFVVSPWEFAGVDDDAADAGPVSADVLGQRVHDDIGTVLEGAAQDGRGNGVIDDQRHTMPVGGIGQCLKVNNIAGRVANGFAEDRLGLVIDQRLKRRDVVMGSETRLDTKARQGMRQQVVSPAIKLGHRDNIVTDFGHGLDRISNSGHTRGHRQGTDTALHGGNALFEHVVGRVHDARVNIACDFQVKQVGTMLSIVECVGCGLVDRHRYCFSCRVGAIACVDSHGFQFHARSFLQVSWVYLKNVSSKGGSQAEGGGRAGHRRNFVGKERLRFGPCAAGWNMPRLNCVPRLNTRSK